MSLSIIGPDGDILETELDKEKQINFGKTKEIYNYGDDLAIVHKNIITAYDNPEFTGDAPDKGTTSAYSSVLLFRRIEKKGVRTSNIGILNSNTTVEIPLEMMPFEIIWRRYHVKGNSLEKRKPNTYTEGQKYPEVIYEVCLKWSVRTNEGEVVHDPFIKLDNNFVPILDNRGLPILMHSKEPRELEYSSFVHPNKGGDLSFEEVKGAISEFSKFAGDIFNLTKTVQEVTLETYASIGRLNADGKIEVGLDKDGILRLGDTLELDSLRNMSLEEVEVNGETRSFQKDLLGKDLYEIFNGSLNNINKIVRAFNSDKQIYRNLVGKFKDEPYNSIRKEENNKAASFVTNTIYTEVALALSDKFSGEVGYRLIRE